MERSTPLWLIVFAIASSAGALVFLWCVCPGQYSFLAVFGVVLLPKLLWKLHWFEKYLKR